MGRPASLDSNETSGNCLPPSGILGGARFRDKRIAELERQVEELKKKATAGTRPVGVLPPFVKPDRRPGRRKKPGRKEEHEAALRPVPAKIDRHQHVPLPKDVKNHPLCPHCRCPLTRPRRRRRIVEDLVPGAVETTCYHTQSGYRSDGPR